MIREGSDARLEEKTCLRKDSCNEREGWLRKNAPTRAGAWAEMRWLTDRVLQQEERFPEKKIEERRLISESQSLLTKINKRKGLVSHSQASPLDPLENPVPGRCRLHLQPLRDGRNVLGRFVPGGARGDRAGDEPWYHPREWPWRPCAIELAAN